MKLRSGQKAPSFIVNDIWDNTIDLSEVDSEKILLSFFRYAECPMCNLQISKIMKIKTLFKEKGIMFIAVFESPSESLKNSIVDRHLFDFTIISDMHRELYNLYSVNPSWLKTLRTMTIKGLQHVYQSKKSGFKILGKTEGTIHQIPADFLIDNKGIIQIAHYGTSIIDHFPLEIILNHNEQH